MAYSEAAKALRRCTGTTKEGKPCKNWAAWDSGEKQLCATHMGRHHRGPIPRREVPLTPPPRQRARYEPCRCPAYQWPHRPGGGLCEWPNVPEYVCTVPQGTKSPVREFLPLARELKMLRSAKRQREMFESLTAEAMAEVEPAPQPEPMPEPRQRPDKDANDPWAGMDLREVTLRRLGMWDARQPEVSVDGPLRGDQGVV